MAVTQGNTATEIPSIEFVIECARKAGTMIRDAFEIDVKQTSCKMSSSDLVTETDVAVEKMLLAAIRQKYPHHSFLCEESCEKKQVLTDAPTWVIDPIDGTMNFVHKCPFVAVSIGFTINKVPELGVIYNPLTRELFYAVRGQGAFLISETVSFTEAKRIHVAPVRTMKESMVAVGFCASIIHKGHENATTLDSVTRERTQEVQDVILYNTQQLLVHCRDLRRLGSCACDMAYVAAGRLDAITELNIKEWDICAGVLLILEAGGCVMNYDGASPPDLGKRQIIGASNLEVAQGLSRLLHRPSFHLRELE